MCLLDKQNSHTAWPLRGVPTLSLACLGGGGDRVPCTESNCSVGDNCMELHCTNREGGSCMEPHCTARGGGHYMDTQYGVFACSPVVCSILSCVIWTDATENITCPRRRNEKNHEFGWWHLCTVHARVGSIAIALIFPQLTLEGLVFIIL